MSQTKRDVLEEELRVIIADIAEIDKEDITLEANFVEDLGVDSMMALEILAALEKRYGLNIPEDDLKKMVNLSQALEIVSQAMKKK